MDSAVPRVLEDSADLVVRVDSVDEDQVDSVGQAVPEDSLEDLALPAVTVAMRAL